MPKEVIHDPTPIRLSEVLCQCDTHAPVVGTDKVGGRAWIQHDVFCGEDCGSMLSSSHPVRIVNSDRSEQSTPFAIEVAWGRETHLQIATVNLPIRQDSNGQSDELTVLLEALKHLSTGPAGGLPSQETLAIKAKAEEAAWMLNSLAGGLYVDLDRDRTNKLIKVLKRARDQAYGADE